MLVNDFGNLIIEQIVKETVRAKNYEVVFSHRNVVLICHLWSVTTTSPELKRKVERVLLLDRAEEFF